MGLPVVVKNVGNGRTKHTRTVSLLADRFTCSVTSFAVSSETLFMHQPFLSIHIFETEVVLERI